MDPDGNQGIGRSAAILFSKEGAKVVVTEWVHPCVIHMWSAYDSLQSIDAKKVDIVVGEIKNLGGDAIGVAGDVAADDFPKKIIDATVQ